jgi:hypothetical protein
MASAMAIAFSRTGANEESLMMTGYMTGTVLLPERAQRCDHGPLCLPTASR